MLFVDDDERLLRAWAHRWRTRSRTIAIACDRDAAVEAARRAPFDLAVVDIFLDPIRGGGGGLTLIPQLKALQPTLHVVAVSAIMSIDLAVRARAAGADDALAKPAELDEILRRRGEPAPPCLDDPPSMERIKWEHAQRALADAGGNVTKAAARLDIDRSTLQRLLNKPAPKR